MSLDYLKLAYIIPTYWASKAFNHAIAKPINVTLSVTNRCYSKCKSCNVWKQHKENPEIAKQEMTLKEWEASLKSLGKTPIWFTITGGETTLRDDLPEIVSLIASYNKPRYINLATSGIYPKKTIKIVRDILKITSKHNILFTLNLSIDEIDEKYEEVRGVPNGFEKVSAPKFEWGSWKRQAADREMKPRSKRPRFVPPRVGFHRWHNAHSPACAESAWPRSALQEAADPPG